MYFPLNQSQMGVFSEWIQNPQSTQYNLPVSCPLDMAIEPTRLKYSLTKIIQERPVLRTRFVADEQGEIRQYSDPDMQVDIPVKEMSENEFQHYCAEGFVRPFDLLSGESLCRFEVVRTQERLYLLLDIHHAISDGLSHLLLLKRDLCLAYDGSPLEENGYGLYEAAEDEQKSFDSASYAKAKEFYRENFQNCEFTHLNAVGVKDSSKIIIKSSFIPMKEVDSWCQKNDTAANLLFMAAFSLVLSRISRNNNVMFYTVNHGRMDKRLMDAYGMFVKTVPILSSVSGEQKVLEFVKHFRRNMMQTIRYGIYPFTHFCRDLKKSPTVSFGFQSAAIQEAGKLNGEMFPLRQLPRRSLMLDLNCVIYCDNDQFEIRLEASEAKYHAEYLNLFAETVKSSILAIMAHPLDSLADLSLLSGSDEQKLLELGRGGALEYDQSETFVDVFLCNAARYPGTPAVVDECSSISYAELDERSDLLAAELRRFGVAKDRFVGLMLPRRKEFLIALLAVFKVGGAYVPLDSEYPDERLRYMLSDSEAEVLISTRGLQKEKNLCVGHTVLLDEFDFSGKAPCVNESKPDGLAYMIYTSGSTGKPKGVMVEHRNLRAFSAWRTSELNLKPGENCAQHASFSFDASLDDLITPLAAGGTVHILASGLRQDIDGMCRYFKEHSIVGLTLSTQLGMELLNGSDDLPLRFLMMGGEKLKPTKHSNVQIINGYGPTEFTVCSSFQKVDQTKTYDNIPIGRPVPNSISAIVDESGHLLPRGMSGELCLIGRQMARGYWHRPELTAEKFAPCPFLPGEKMYHTGDLARWNASGELEYQGRIDNQVKLRGFRIEMGEIETALVGFPGIQSAAAEVKEVNNAPQLCAYYTSTAAVDEAALRRHLASSLTEYMVPAFYILLDTMPLTPNGKIDRKALPVPRVESETFVAPETELEKKLFALVAEEMKTTEFGVTTNLLSLGLSSIRAIRLSLTIQKRLNRTLKTADILKVPRIREWKTLFAESRDSIKTYPKQEFYPLTDNQLGIYLNWEHSPESLQYNVPCCLKMREKNASTLLDALKTVLAAHPGLKMRLLRKNGEIVQKRCDTAEFSILCERLKNEPDPAFFQSRIRPFHLLSESLARFEVYEYEEQIYLFFDIHHILFDGSAAGIFFADLHRAYSGEVIDAETFTAFDYSLYCEDWRTSAAFVKAEHYFDELLADTSSLRYPGTDGADSENGSAQMLIRHIPFHPVIRYCRLCEVTQNCFFSAAFLETLQRLTREKSFQIVTISNGRGLRELEHTLGMFVQTLPLIYQKKNRNIRAFLSSMQRQISSTLEYDNYSYVRLAERHKLKPEVMFVYQGGVMEKNEIDAEEIPLKLTAAKFPLALIVVPDGENCRLQFEYDGGRYSEHDIQILGDAMCNLMDDILNNDPAAMVADLSTVAEPDVSALLELGRGGALEYDQSETFVDVFLCNAARYPGTPAVVDECSSISYAELDERSDLLAAELRRFGVAKDRFVGLMLPRRKEFLIALLAVFKVGGAYVPLDSEYPDERLRYMLSDSEAEVLISTRGLQKEKNLCVGHTVLLDEFDFSGKAPCVNESKPDGLAYMIYTSGSTGKPKGVMVEHRNLRAFSAWRTSELNLKPGENCAQHASFSFDASLDDLITPLAAGGTVHILASGLRQDIDGMCRYFKEHSIVGLTLSTQLGMELLNGSDDLPLRFLMMGGEKLKPTKHSNVQIINGYGPTEFTVCSSFQKVDQTKTYDNIPIGRPVPNSISAIVDESGHLLPRGMSGELCLIGRQMARGYWHRPELTAEKFAPCPFLPGEKMYHTGDLARWNASGELEYQGRIDNQVKLRGFRIEMGEIETALVGFPGIQSAAAEVKEVNNAPQLCAYYTSTAAVDEAALRRHLASSLTEYMVPAFYILLDTMPLTPNGKIDRKALPIPDLSCLQKLENVPPETNKEAALLRIAQEILQNKEFGVTDDLLALGMSSIQAIRFSAQVQKLKIHISTSTLAKKRSIRRILAASPTIFSWHKPYDPEKPVLVYFLGLSYPAFSQEFLNRLTERFSVLVFEPIGEHYKYLFLNETFTDLLNLYFDIIRFKLPKDAEIFGFSGICWGGVIAYHLADMYRNSYAEKPYVFLIDSFLYSDEERECLRDKMKNVDLSSANFSVTGADYHDYEHRSEAAVSKMEDLHPYPAYDGPVVLFSSEKNGCDDFKKANLAHWKQLAPRIEIIAIDDDHIRVCEAEEHFSTYLKKIFSRLDHASSITPGKQS